MNNSNPLSRLFNPQNITGIIVYYGTKRPVEIELASDQAFQDKGNKIELWQRNKETMTKVRGWMKRNITHYKINGQFIPHL